MGLGGLFPLYFLAVVPAVRASLSLEEYDYKMQGRGVPQTLEAENSLHLNSSFANVIVTLGHCTS